MPIYYYQAIKQDGKKQQGSIEAKTETLAKSQLRDRGLMVKSVSTKSFGVSKAVLKGGDLLNFTVQLSQLVNANVPLYQSLIAIEEQYQNESFHPIILSLADQIKGGLSLSDSMKNWGGSFNKLYISMIKAGEVSGSLGLVLDRLKELIRAQMRLKKEISTAMIYPVILATFSFFIIIMLLGFVVPSIEGIFEGRKLNSFTTFILMLSHFMREKWWVYLPAIALFLLSLFIYFRGPKGRLNLEKLLMKLPFIKNVIIMSALSRFLRTMATLRQGGLNMIESLQLAREVMQNRTLEAEMKAAEIKIVEGSSLSAELKNSSYIPKIVSRMIAIGEDSGTTDIMFNNVAEMYEETLEKNLSRTVALAQPLILIFMGGVIGAVMVAILLPLTDIAAFSG